MHEAIRERNIGINLRQRASRILVFPIAVEHVAENPGNRDHVTLLRRQAKCTDAHCGKFLHLPQQIGTRMRHGLHSIHGKERLAIERGHSQPVRIFLANETAIVL